MVAGRHLGPPGDGYVGGLGEGGAVATKDVVDVANGVTTAREATGSLAPIPVPAVPAGMEPTGQDPSSKARLLGREGARGGGGPVAVGGGEGEVGAAEMVEGGEDTGL